MSKNRKKQPVRKSETNKDFSRTHTDDTSPLENKKNGGTLIGFYIRSIALSVLVLVAAWYVLVYDYHDESEIEKIVTKIKQKDKVTDDELRLGEGYQRYSKTKNYQWFHNYKWLIQSNLMQNLDIISDLKKRGVSSQQIQEYKSRFDYRYLVYIAEHTPKNAVILMPDAEDLKNSPNPNQQLKSIGDKAWSYYFLYPRKLVYDQHDGAELINGKTNYSKDPDYEQNRKNISHVAIANGKGYEHLNYNISNQPTETILAVDSSKNQPTTPFKDVSTNYPLVALSLLITFILGLSIIFNISLSFSYMEKLGLSFLLGMGIQAFGMIIFDFVGIPIHLSTIYILSFAIITGCWLRLIKTQKTNIKKVIFPYNPFKGKAWHKINFAWLSLFGIVTFLLWAINTKCLYFPPFEFDSITGYDLMAKVLAEEGTFNNSLFQSNGRAIFNTAHRLIYPPLVSGSFAYAYMSGATTSKIISSLFYLCFIISMYGLLRRLRLTHLNTIFTILLIMLVPELTGHASLSQTNMPQGVYTSISVILFFIWYIKQDKNIHFLYLSMLFFACNAIIRTENVVFAVVIGVLLLVQTIQCRDMASLKKTILFGSVTLLPLLLWMLFLNMNNMKPNVPIDPGFVFSYDAQKFTDWWGLMWGYEKFKSGVLINKGYFALTSYLYFITLLMSVLALLVQYFIKRRTNTTDHFKNKLKIHIVFIYITLGIVITYSLFYYILDYNWEGIHNVMKYSYKRGLFSVMILFCFFIGANFLTKGVFNRINKFLYQ